MKSYLDLVPISARVHRKQTRMTRLCILLSVFLIASLFSMADMFLRSQKAQAVQNDGAWHVLFRGLTPEQEAVLDIRPEIQTGGRYLYCNINLDQDLFLEGDPVAVAGMEPAVLELHPYLQILEGRFPEAADEILLSENAVKDLGREIGDTVQITVSGTARAFRICGILENTSAMERRGAFAALFTLEAYSETFGAVPGGNHEYYVQFVQHCRIDDALTDICQQLQIDRADVAENTKLLALMLQSGDVYVQKLSIRWPDFWPFWWQSPESS